MNKFIRILSAALAVVTVSSLVAGCAKTEKPAPAPESKTTTSESAPAVEGKTLKFALLSNENDAFYVAAEKFKELVEERTKGTVKIEIYPNATLGDERSSIEGMQIGTIDMGIVTSGPVANFVPKVSAFEMPFLFTSEAEAYEVLDGKLGQGVLDELSTANLKGLAFAERGFRNLSNSKKAVATPADMKGLKIRVMETPLYIATFKALGANAVPMAWNEALTAMQQGAIDGQENPVNTFVTYKLHETQSHLSLTKHTYAAAIFVMSQKIFDAFPAETQEILVQSAKEAATYERQWIADQMDAQLKLIKENGVTVTEPNLALFQEAVKPVYSEFAPKYGTLVADIQAQLAK